MSFDMDYLLHVSNVRYKYCPVAKETRPVDTRTTKGGVYLI